MDDLDIIDIEIAAVPADVQDYIARMVRSMRRHDLDVPTIRSRALYALKRGIEGVIHHPREFRCSLPDTDRDRRFDAAVIRTIEAALPKRMRS